MASRDEQIVFKLRTEGAGEVDKLAKEIEGFAADAGDAARPADELLKSLRELGQQRAAIDTFERTGAALRKSSNEFRDAQTRVRELAQQIRASEEPTKQLSKDYERAQAEVSRLATAQEKARDAFRAAKTETDRLGVSTKNLGESARGVDRAFDAQSTALRKLRDETRDAATRSRDLAAAKENLRETLRNSRAQLAAFGLSLAGLGAIIGKASGEAREYGLALAEVSTLLDDTSGIEATSAAVRELAQQFGTGATDQARALYQIISAGAQEGAEATGVLTQANRLALAGLTDITTAADGLTTVLNAYGLEASESGRVSDAFFAAVRAGKTTVDELASSIGRVAPIAATANVSIEDLLSATAALTKGGVGTNEAMTQLRAVIAGVVKPTEDAKKAAAELGIEFNLAALRSKGLSGFLDEIAQSTEGNEEALARLFGSVEGLNAVFALTGNQAVSFSETLAQVADSAGATDEALQRIQNTPEFAFRQLSSAASELRVSLGELANLALVPLAKALTEAIRGFNELPAAVQGGAVIIGGALGTYLVFGKTLAGIATALRAVQLAAGPAAASTLATGTAAATALAPIKALAAAIGVLVSAKVAIPLAVAGAVTSLVRLAQVAAEVRESQQGLLDSTGTLIERIEAIQATYGQYANTIVKTREELAALSEAQLGAYLEALEGAQQLERANESAQRSITRNAAGAAEAARRVEEYAAAIDAAKVAQRALSDEQTRGFFEARRGLSDFAREAITAFTTAQEAGEDAAAALATVFDQLDLTAADGINELVAGITAIGAASTASGEAIEGAIITRIAQLTSTDLAALQARLSEALQAGAGDARALGAALDGVGETIRQRLGVDLQAIATGITATGREALAAFDSLSAELDRIGITGQQRFQATSQAIRATLRQLSTSEELAEFDKRVQEAFAKGEISAEEYAEVMREIRGETEQVAATTQRAGRIIAGSWNRATEAAQLLQTEIQRIQKENEELEADIERRRDSLSAYMNALQNEFGSAFAQEIGAIYRGVDLAGLSAEQALGRIEELRVKQQDMIAAERRRLEANAANTAEYQKQSDEATKLRNEALAAGASMAEALRIAQQGTREIRAGIDLQKAAQQAPDRKFTVEIRVNGDVTGTQEVIDEITRRVVERIEADRRLTQ